jgi:hypothetical protein
MINSLVHHIDGAGFARVIDGLDRKMEFVFVPFWGCRGLRCRSVDRRAAGLQHRDGHMSSNSDRSNSDLLSMV